MPRVLWINRSYGGRLPRDFPQRLERFKEASGLTWTWLARRIGVSRTRLHGWRRGTVPRGGGLFCLIRLARTVPGGIDILVPEDEPPAAPSFGAPREHGSAA